MFLLFFRDHNEMVYLCRQSTSYIFLQMASRGFQKKMLKCHEFELHWETILKPGLCIMTQQLKERWKAFLFDIIVILALRNDDLMIT